MPVFARWVFVLLVKVMMRTSDELMLSFVPGIREGEKCATPGFQHPPGAGL